jgi:hypothetical protein
LRGCLTADDRGLTPPNFPRKLHANGHTFMNHQAAYKEVRYGSGTANALQRGLWTNTKNGIKYFDSVTNGWIDYSHNHVLVKLFAHALIATSKGHEVALVKLKEDIEEQKQQSNLK